MIGTPTSHAQIVIIKYFNLDTVKTVLPKYVGEWITDYLIKLNEKPLSNSIKKFLKNEAVERVKYVSHDIVLRLFLALQVPKEGK